MERVSRVVQSLLGLLCLSCHVSYAAVNAFYVLHYQPQQVHANQVNVSALKQHHRSMQLIISQAYHIDSAGNVSGYINEDLLKAARSRSVKFMAMVTNTLYDQQKLHRFLISVPAQERAIRALLQACNQHHFYGIQFDFENISIHDKQALTAFYLKAASALHRHGYKVSFAVIPAFVIKTHESSFLSKTYENWSGAYDLKALGKAADFITLMAYNQHPDGTIPGPNASITYVQAAIKNALSAVPARKLSLGVPTYSLHFYSGHHRINMRQDEISYQDAMRLVKKYHPQLVWSPVEKVRHAVFEHNWLNEYIYFEDAQAFKAKLALARRYKLHGISVFRIGTEDKKIWTLLATK